MVDWDFIIDESALASVLPGAYARFARPVKDALSLFLSGLSEPRQAEILQAQAALGPTATISQRLGRFAQSCPVLHKLGQILARDRRLAAELRCELQLLESLPPAVPLEQIESTLAKELGPLDRLGVTLTPPAIAEASVAVVIPFRQRHHRGSQPNSGVFKLLKPGIEDRLHDELELLEQIGALLDQRCEELSIPRLDYRESFQQVRDKLRNEVQLDEEQRHLAQAAVVYQHEPRVQIPRLLNFCTPRVTAMERVTGGKITDHALGSPLEQRRLAELVVRALIAQPIFAETPQAVFHSDPHAGNLFLTDDGRLAILDWSLVAELGQHERSAIVQALLGALTLNADTIIGVLDELAERQRPDVAALKLVVQSWLGRICRGEFPGFKWLMGMLDEAVQVAGLRLGGDLMLFRKSIFTIEGVVAELGAEGFQLDETLASEFLFHFAMEWPRRWISPPHSRDYATRLSNLDLARLMLSLPSTATRFWLHNVSKRNVAVFAPGIVQLLGS